MRLFLPFRLFALILAGLIVFMPGSSLLAQPESDSTADPHTPVASDGSRIDSNPPQSDDIIQTNNGAYSKEFKGNNTQQWEKFVSEENSSSATADDPSTESIIGSDSRTRVKDPSLYPYRAIVHIESDIGNCTGWMIGPDRSLPPAIVSMIRISGSGHHGQEYIADETGTRHLTTRLMQNGFIPLQAGPARAIPTTIMALSNWMKAWEIKQDSLVFAGNPVPLTESGKT